MIDILRTLLIFFVGGLLMNTAFISLVLLSGTVWLDCFHDNPNHTCGDALLFVAVSPLYGMAIGMTVGFLPLIAGAALAGLGRANFHRVPLWYVIAILPACVLAWRIQGSSWFSYNQLRPSFLWFSVFQVPALLICWWWDRRGTWA